MKDYNGQEIHLADTVVTNCDMHNKPLMTCTVIKIEEKYQMLTLKSWKRGTTEFRKPDGVIVIKDCEGL